MTADVHRFRLSAMMFGQFLIMGTWAVTLGTFLMASPLKGGMNFSPSHTGWIYSTLALAGIIAPIFMGLLADRLFSAEKLMGCLHLLGAILLGLAAWWCFEQQPRIATAYRAAAAVELVDGVPVLEAERRVVESPVHPSPELSHAIKEAFQRINRAPELERRLNETFLPLFVLMLGYAFCCITGITLSNVIAFRNLADPQHSFGKVRLHGTVGWIVAGVQLELFWNTVSPAPLFLAAGMSAVFGFFCFALPNTAPTGRSKSLRDALGLPALSMFRDRSFCAVVVCSLGISAVQQFYGVYSNRFLTELRAPYPAAVQTIAQVSEVICMMFAPAVLLRLGLKATMALGLFGWIARNGLFATESLPLIVAIGLPLHGMSYAFFVMIASMYVDRRAPLHLRASAQGIYTFVSMGAGTLFGNWLGATVVQSQTTGDVVSWPTVWLVPTCLSAAIFMAFLVLFRESSVRSPGDSRS